MCVRVGTPQLLLLLLLLLFFCFVLCHVAVFVRRALTSLDVLLVDEDLDALLDHTDTGVKSGFGLVDDLQTGRMREQQGHVTIMLNERSTP